METEVRTLNGTKSVVECVVGELRKSDYPKDRAVVLTLSGPLGVGKTAFVKCLADILNVSSGVTSPSFVLRSDYDTGDTVLKHLIHIDAYRLEDPSEIETVGWNDVLRTPNTLVVVEWPERIPSYIPEDAYAVFVRFRGAARVFTAGTLTTPAV